LSLLIIGNDISEQLLAKGIKFVLYLRILQIAYTGLQINSLYKSVIARRLK